MGESDISSIMTFRIPKDEPFALPDLAVKYRDLRLAGLRLSPESFSSTYEVESGYNDSVWESRLRRPRFETFIAAVVPRSSSLNLVSHVTSDAAHPPAGMTTRTSVPGQPTGVDASTSTCIDASAKWIAQVTLREPLSEASYALPLESGQVTPSSSLPHEDEEKWQLLSLYMHPSHRGRGIAQLLCNAAFEWLADRGSRSVAALYASPVHAPIQIRVRAMVKPDNHASLRLFQQKLGFVHSGRCTLAEALRANGEIAPHEVVAGTETSKPKTQPEVGTEPETEIEIEMEDENIKDGRDRRKKSFDSTKRNGWILSRVIDSSFHATNPSSRGGAGKMK